MKREEGKEKQEEGVDGWMERRRSRKTIGRRKKEEEDRWRKGRERELE